jgi:hypothetical protein
MKKLNIICALIFAVLAVNVLSHFGLFALGVQRGYSAKQNACETVAADTVQQHVEDFLLRTQTLHLLPTDLLAAPDSVTNLKTGQRIPISYYEVSTISDVRQSVGLFVADLFMGLCMIILSLLAFIGLIRFVVNINRSQIFVWRNVKQLRRLGLYLIAIYLLYTVANYLECRFVAETIELEGYTINWSKALEDSNLLFGLATLLVAEVFAVGLRLQEEQDLTI